MTVIEDICKKLAGLEYRQSCPEEVRTKLRLLLPKVPPLVEDYFSTVQGPIGSSSTGYQLLDVLSGEASVLSSTEFCRKKFGFKESWLVLSDLLGNALLVYDAIDDKVFNVDFEGGVELLFSEDLEPIALSFESFLKNFHGVNYG